MTRVIQSLLTFLIAATVLLQGTALAVMVTCHQGVPEQFDKRQESSASVVERCQDHHPEDTTVHTQRGKQDSAEQACCGCHAVCKVGLDLPVITLQAFKSSRIYPSYLPAIQNSTDLVLPYRPPILA